MARKRDHSVRLKRGLVGAFRKGVRYPQPVRKLRYSRGRLNRGGNNNNNNNNNHNHNHNHNFAIERGASVLCTLRAITAVALSKLGLPDSET